MAVLSWDKPPKQKSVEEWKELSADSAPPGVYTPNMSYPDREKWKAKVTGMKLGTPQVEIRKTVKGAQLLIIVGLDGYNYKYYRHSRNPLERHSYKTDGLNIHMATNGPVQMTFEDFDDMHAAVTEAREHLRTLLSDPLLSD